MNCPLCCQKVKLHEGEEGTNSYIPMEREQALEEAVNAAYSIDTFEAFGQASGGIVREAIIRAIKALSSYPRFERHRSKF